MSAPVLGVSFDYHDSAAALVTENGIVAAVQEERLTRRKGTSTLPGLAIAFCLKKAGLKPEDVEVVYYENPILKFSRILRSLENAPDERRRGTTVLARWLKEGRFDIADRLVAKGFDRRKLHRVEHHQSHAASAFLCSPFQRATIVTLDGVGEDETGSVWLGAGPSMSKIRSFRFPHSLGLFYSALTSYLGFEVNEGEYKVMGMAPYGTPRFAQIFLDMFTLEPDGGFVLDQDLFDFSADSVSLFSQKFVDRFGPPRPQEQPFLEQPDDLASLNYADIAASAQRATEEVILHVVRNAIRETGVRQICLAGGVALNSVANGRLQRELGAELFVQPAAGDAGGALGAALYWRHEVEGVERDCRFTTAYLGPEFSDFEIEAALRIHSLGFEAADSNAAMVASIASALRDGQVVGWFQGRAEWGPRALGARSILASPLSSAMRDTVNEKVKFRELFRPFAPSVAAEHAHRFFHLSPIHDLSPEHFMVSVCPVREEARDVIPAVTHVDGSARVHLVRRDAMPVFHQLISEFAERTGTPVLLNTSFNRRGEPIVNSPADAIQTFLGSGIDVLVLGRHIVRKSELNA